VRCFPDWVFFKIIIFFFGGGWALTGGGGLTSGSGWVAVVWMDSGAHGEHFGAKFERFGAVLRVLRDVFRMGILLN
jgi:hypothetical protein